jgi:hypothetical protein
MITLRTATNINDDEFDKLYADSIEAMNAGTFPWADTPQIQTDDEKKAHIRNQFDLSLSIDENLIVEVRDDELLLGLMLCKVIDKNGKKPTVLLALISPDASGSRSWLYSEELKQARVSYRKALGFNKWGYITTVRDSAMHRSIQSRIYAGAFPVSVSAREQSEPHRPMQEGVPDRTPMANFIVKIEEDE